MGIRKLAAVAGVMAVVFAACGGSAATTAPATAAPATEAPATAAPASEAPASEAAAQCTVGVSWNNYQEERWAKWDEPAIKAAIEAGGGKYISNDAKSSAETQASNVENLISQGANVVIVLAQDGTAIKPAVASAISNGVPVIAYDRLIEDPQALYITFDNKLVGKMQAEALLKVKDSGNFVVVKGNKADANADFLRAGMVEAGLPPAGESNDKLKNVGEGYTDNWDPANAQKAMEQYLTANDNKIDIAFVQNDGMAGGVIAALAAQGLAGKRPGLRPGRRPPPPSTGSPSAPRRSTSGRTPASSARRPVRQPSPCATDPDIKKVAGVVAVRLPRRQRHDLDLPHPDPDHQGQPERRARRRLDRPGDAVQGRSGGLQSRSAAEHGPRVM